MVLWKEVARVLKDPAEVQKRVVKSWTSVGLVTAFFASLTYQTAILPPAFPTPYDTPSNAFVQAFGVLTALCFVLSVVTCCMLIAQISLAGNEHVLEFTERFGIFFNVPLIFLMVGIFSGGLSLVLASYIGYGTVVWKIVVVFAAVGAAFGFGLYFKLQAFSYGLYSTKNALSEPSISINNNNEEAKQDKKHAF